MRIAMAGALVGVLALAVPTGAVGPRAYDGGSADGPTTGRATVDDEHALVQLRGEPLSTDTRTKPGPGQKIDFNSSTTRSLRAQLSALRNDFRRWLRSNAPRAQVTGWWDISLNAVSVRLNGTSLDTLRAAPQAVRAEHAGLYYKSSAGPTDPALGLISALDAWADVGGSAKAGEGVKVAVVDSGIDQTHPCFSDAGYPVQAQLGDRRFTNNKVIVARVFNNKLNQNRFDARAVDGHGTHVAGTIACNFGTRATVDGATIPHAISGVAPRALLGNYNVFPGTVASARSEDILNALEAAYADGMDIVNMSLGGGARGRQDLLTIAVDNLDQANMVVAVAAGNSGPGHFTVESPGSAARALTAGASTVNHQVANPITAVGADSALTASAPGVIGDFGVPSSYPVTGTLSVLLGDGVSGLSLACVAVPPAPPTDSVALIARGGCTFSVKLRHVQQAGYEAAIVVNNVAGAPFTMGQDGAPSQPTIPGWMIGLEAAGAFKAANLVVSIAAPAYTYPYYSADVMAGFSSQGPTDVDFRVKPDLVAPGVNVLSSVPQSYCSGVACFAFFEGTSMAAPHLAGAAAIVRQANPTWPAWAIRSAIVNTADSGVLTRFTLDGPATDVNVAGTGRLNLASAVNAPIALDPVSVSFGAVPSGSGQTRTFAVDVTNRGATLASLSITPATGTGVTFTVSPTSVAAGATATVTITASFAKGAPAGHRQAWLVASAGATTVARAAVYAFVK
ncbi:MAG TPA: S8 family serine peptidase [Patescibacteria group bacterium]|nr:S8 family serine peptidase [Patescibacteria group bacterium]